MCVSGTWTSLYEETRTTARSKWCQWVTNNTVVVKRIVRFFHFVVEAKMSQNVGVHGFSHFLCWSEDTLFVALFTSEGSVRAHGSGNFLAEKRGNLHRLSQVQRHG